MSNIASSDEPNSTNKELDLLLILVRIAGLSRFTIIIEGFSSGKENISYFSSEL